jgi:hypothetical protein
MVWLNRKAHLNRTYSPSLLQGGTLTPSPGQEGICIDRLCNALASWSRDVSGWDDGSLRLCSCRGAIFGMCEVNIFCVVYKKKSVWHKKTHFEAGIWCLFFPWVSSWSSCTPTSLKLDSRLDWAMWPLYCKRAGTSGHPLQVKLSASSNSEARSKWLILTLNCWILTACHI